MFKTSKKEFILRKAIFNQKLQNAVRNKDMKTINKELQKSYIAEICTKVFDFNEPVDLTDLKEAYIRRTTDRFSNFNRIEMAM